MDSRKEKLPVIVTVGPAVIWLFLFIVLPIAYVVLMSFAQMNNRQLCFQFSLQNYIMVFSSLYLSIYSDSFIIALFTTLLCILFGYPAAYIIASATPKRKKIYNLLLMMPFYTNLIVRLNGWKNILDKSGVVNSFLLQIGVIKEPLTLIYTQGAVVLGMVYSLFPFMVLPLISSITNLDKTLLEASYDLGGNPFTTFLRVVLPQTQPGIFAGTIMVFIPTMSYFFVSDVMGGAKHKLIGSIIEVQFGQAYNWPLGAAFAVILIVMTLIMVNLYKKSGGSKDSFGVF